MNEKSKYLYEKYSFYSLNLYEYRQFCAKQRGKRGAKSGYEL
jgi:hypothetical protein